MLADTARIAPFSSRDVRFDRLRVQLQGTGYLESNYACFILLTSNASREAENTKLRSLKRFRKG